MTDDFQAEHTKLAQEVQNQVYRSMTPTQKFRIIEDLYLAAWELKAAWFRKLHPELTNEQIEAKVREAMLYARD